MPPKRKGTVRKARTLKKARTAALRAAEAAEGSSESTLSASDETLTLSSTSTTTSSSSAEIKTTTDDGRSFNLKITSWNVAGIRAWLKKGGVESLVKIDADIVFLQETKCSDADLPNDIRNIAGYKTYWAEAKSGRAGVGLLTKVEPIKVDIGLGIENHDKEGRLITAEYDGFYLVGCYVPNSGRGLPRLEYRREFNADFKQHLKTLDASKPVICTGDLNVAYASIDLAKPKANLRNAGFTVEEREDFEELLKCGFVDSFRRLYPQKPSAYTFWTYLGNARDRNIGWRLDYFLISARLVPNLCDSVMNSSVFGSDHCPITLYMAM